MTAPYAPQPSPTVGRPGRGLIIAGAVLLALSVIIGIVGVALVVPRLNLDTFQRQVAIEGAADRLIPGTIAFEVLEPLDSGDPEEMTVGIALSDTTGGRPECTISEEGGAPIDLASATSNDTLIDVEGSYADWSLVNTVRLGPGAYEASCEPSGEPSARSGASFTVGRVFGVDDVEQLLGPAVGLLAAIGVAGLAFLVGLVLLVIGLVRRSRAKRSSQFPGPLPPGGPPAPGAYTSWPGAPSPTDPSAPNYPPASPPPAPPQPPGTMPPGTMPPAPPPMPPQPPPAPAPPPPPEGGGSAGGWTVPPSKR